MEKRRFFWQSEVKISLWLNFSKTIGMKLCVSEIQMVKIRSLNVPKRVSKIFSTGLWVPMSFSKLAECKITRVRLSNMWFAFQKRMRLLMKLDLDRTQKITTEIYPFTTRSSKMIFPCCKSISTKGVSISRSEITNLRQFSTSAPSQTPYNL